MLGASYWLLGRRLFLTHLTIVVSLTVPLGWTLSDNDHLVEAPDDARAQTGITRYSYTRMAQTHLPLFLLRFENTDNRPYAFNDSQGERHSIRPLFIGMQELKINSIEGSSIVSVTLPLRITQDKEARSVPLTGHTLRNPELMRTSRFSITEKLDGLCTEISWPLTDEVKWVTPPLPVQVRTGIKEYSYSWRMLCDMKHYSLDVFGLTGANFVFGDRSGTEMKLSATSGGKHQVHL